MRAPQHPRPLAGLSILVVAGAHLALGATRYAPVFADMVRDGWVGSTARGGAGTALERQRAFWFEVTGVGLLLLGAQTRLLERQGVRPPRQTGWALAGLALAGGATVPVSGFWALLVPAALLVRDRPPAPQPGHLPP